MSIVITVLWLVSASAWAQGVSDIKYYTDPVESGIFFNKKIMPECAKDKSCEVTYLGNFAGLNVSCVSLFCVYLGDISMSS